MAGWHRKLVVEDSSTLRAAIGTQNAAHYPAGTGGNAQDVTPEEDLENADLLVSMGASDTLQNDPLGRGGFEPPKA